MYIIPKIYERYSIRSSVFRSTLSLPSIITRLDLYLSTLELKNRLNLPVEVEYLISALTTPYTEMVIDYESFEILGDSFLNFYIKELYEKFAELICNTMFCKSAKNLFSYEYINSHSLESETRRPVVKAILGAAYLTNGEDLGLRCAKMLN